MGHECVILADSPSALVELCGISTLERLLRMLQRCGIMRATVFSGTPKMIAEELARPSWARGQMELTIRQRPNGLVTTEQIVDVWPGVAQLILLIDGGSVFDMRLLQLLSAQTSAAAMVDSAVPPQLQSLVASAPNTRRGKLCGASLLQYDWALAQSGPLEEALRTGLERRNIAALDVADQQPYSPGLRRNLRPFWFPAPTAEHQKLAEQVLLDSVQKGALDFPALIHAPIETFLLSHLWKTSITPNQLTISWIVGALATTVLFATGHLAWGVALALIIGILDGLDGKQARIKVETTQRGDLEHRFDDFLDIAWPTALAYYLHSSGLLPGAFCYLLVLVLAEALDGLGKTGIYFASRKMMREAGRFDRVIRFVGGRRNVYVWVLAVGIILGAPAKAFIVMTWWELMTAAFDLPHAGWALYRWRKKLRSELC